MYVCMYVTNVTLILVFHLQTIALCSSLNEEESVICIGCTKGNYYATITKAFFFSKWPQTVLLRTEKEINCFKENAYFRKIIFPIIRKQLFTSGSVFNHRYFHLAFGE